jgi:hypothetical protein
MAIYWRCQAWLLAEFFGAQKQVADLNDRFRLRFDIAGTPRKPVWKIDVITERMRDTEGVMVDEILVNRLKGKTAS